MRKLTRRTDALLVATLGLGGCYVGLSEPAGADGSEMTPGEAGDSDGVEDGTDSDTDGAGDGGDGGDGVPTDDACQSAGAPQVALRFLTRLEYQRTIDDLLGDSRGVVDTFVPDEAAGGFASNSFQAPSSTQLERFVDAAKILATAAVHEERTRFVDCGADDLACIEPFVLLLSPFAPHIAEQLWQALGHATSAGKPSTLAYEPWPEYDEAYLKQDSIELPVQVNGKVRGKVTVPADADQAAVLAVAKADEKVAGQIEGKTIVKEIVVPG